MIWFKKYTTSDLNTRPQNNLGGLLNIVFTEIGDDFIEATMPVNDKTKQPAGILHGGASVVLAETIGSIASNMVIDAEKLMGVGLEINANHLRPVVNGQVTAKCTPIHLGNKTHVWDIKLYNDEGKMTCISRLTVAIIPRMKV
ncbi:hotdog fold thioesterase [Pseudopedobacter beijingensis]|uniref:Hotdog fold thioesterase n=1 Tax=Pseudopedobacter beijingensis TaxID=1207056 RepID=A0ABW4I8Q6_9SPHI